MSVLSAPPGSCRRLQKALAGTGRMRKRLAISWREEASGKSRAPPAIGAGSNPRRRPYALIGGNDLAGHSRCRYSPVPATLAPRRMCPPHRLPIVPRQPLAEPAPLAKPPSVTAYMKPFALPLSTRRPIRLKKNHDAFRLVASSETLNKDQPDLTRSLLGSRAGVTARTARILPRLTRKSHRTAARLGKTCVN